MTTSTHSAWAFSDEDLRDIAGRASTIDERLAGQVDITSPRGAAESARVDRLFRKWRLAAADGDEATFARRLRLDGLDEPAARGLLGRAHLPAAAPLPDWAKTFAHTVARTDDAPAPPPAGAPEDPVPFEDLLWPMVLSARRFLAGKVGDRTARLFAPAAVAALERSLLTRLALVCGPGLFGDFRLFRRLVRPRRVRASPPGSRVIYDAYVARWRDGGQRAYFLARPVAARLIGVTVSHWVDGVAELARRLACDREAIGERFAAGAKLGPVESIKTDLSDPHRRGRTVSILTFAGGPRVVYKPKELHIDAAWANLVDWVNDREPPVSLRAVRVLVRDGYGWCEFIGADKDPDQRNQALFYRRAGGLLAVLHMLGACDFHHENVIADGGFPVPVDLETLVRPAMAGAAEEDPTIDAFYLARSRLRESVLGTAFLPGWAPDAGGENFVAIGGIEVSPETSRLGEAFRWANSDAMAIADVGRADEAAPALGGSARLAIYKRDFKAGFAELYDHLVGVRQELLKPDGPLEPFRRVMVRVVLKSTRDYGLAQRRARAHAHLADGAAWSLHFDELLRDDLMNTISAKVWAMRAAERRAAAEGDIPMFTVRGNASWLQAGPGQRISSCLASSPFARVRKRIQSLGDLDRRFQERIIDGLVALRPGALNEYSVAEPDMRDVAPQDLADPALTSMAMRLGDLLADSAIRVDDSVAWYGLFPLDHDHNQLSVLGAELYGGTIGISLFLAALWRVTGETRFRDLALSAAIPARAGLTSRLGPQFARALGIGGGSGVGSILYGLVRIAGLLDEPDVLADVRKVVGLVDDRLIAADRSHDVIAGAAGAILSLLAFHRAYGDEAALRAAVACGRHLLQARIANQDGDPGWARAPSHQARHLTGFSQGAAGIALALLRLYRETGESEFRVTAEGALAYERKLFMPHLNNWPDLRVTPSSDVDAAPCQWCHGAAGIGLARVGCLDLIDDVLTTGEIEAAASTTLAAPTSNLDHLCCGNFGRIEFLLSAGLRLDRPDLTASARGRATARVEQAAGRGHFIWPGGDDRMNPGFFRGVSGIGYELLRLGHPETLPSILLWD